MPLDDTGASLNALGDRLNASQSLAAEEIQQSIKYHRHHLVTGDAGYGKTRLIQEIAIDQQRKKRKVVLTAPTHQACGVLRRKMKAANIDVPVVTTHALLGLKPEFRGDRLSFVRDRHAEPINADIVGIDETSMIGAEMFDHINRWLNGRSVIFSGDQGQLNPVGEKESPTFAASHHSRLTEPVRQAADNPVLKAAWAIRACQSGPVDWSWCASEHSGPYGVFLPRDAEAWMRKAFTSTGFDADSMTFRFICWTNKRVAQINAMVREWRYGPTDTPFVVGERALIRAPLIKAKAILLNTNEEVVVREIRPSSVKGLETWTLQVETEDKLTIEAHMPRDDRQYNAKIARLADEAKSGVGTWRQYHGFKQSLITAQAIYCLTTHNCQGLTLRNTFLDLAEMRRWIRADQIEGLRGLYVAATRPSHGLICV